MHKGTSRPILAEYIWLDGTQPTARLRSKTKVLWTPPEYYMPNYFPNWTFDGSSTNQAEGVNSDLILTPQRIYTDPFREDPAFLVWCEPNQASVKFFERYPDVKIGFEQEYFLFDERMNESDYPDKSNVQGLYYCGVGDAHIRNRYIVEQHLSACLKAGIKLYGINAEVAFQQWEFQIDAQNPLKACDDLWIARYLLLRISEQHKARISFEPKPIQHGDWNGSGLHTAYSDHGNTGLSRADMIIRLQHKHKEHIAVYGAGNEKRLTGKHETAHINEFKSGHADRTASIRIPLLGNYIEDRRPAANANPYDVVRRLLLTLNEDE